MHFRKHFYMAPEGGDGTGTGGGGGYVPMTGDAFVNALPPEFRGHTALAPIKDMGSLVKSFVNAQGMVGADKLVLPKADAGDADWNPVYDKLGRPPAPDKYSVTMPKAESLPKGFPYSEGDHKNLMKIFHDAGLTDRQAKKAFDAYIKQGTEEYTKASQAIMEKQTALRAELQKKYGADTPVKIEMAKQTVQRLGGQELRNFMDQTGLGDHPAMVNLFLTLSDLIANDKMIMDKFVNSGFISSKEEATSEIARLKLDKDFMAAYTDQTNIGHAAAVERLGRLYKVLNPGQVAGS